jgi:hypothetical protein
MNTLRILSLVCGPSRIKHLIGLLTPFFSGPPSRVPPAYQRKYVGSPVEQWSFLDLIFPRFLLIFAGRDSD